MDLSNLKLYQSAGSPNSRRVRIFLAEKGLKLTLVPVDLGKGEQRSDKYRLINPREMVPTLVLEDGTAIPLLPGATIIWPWITANWPRPRRPPWPRTS